jgi:multicomponent Na+:H+ antiporter subunit D
VILVLFAFGIGKAALMPVHAWLPNAMVAPTPVSALLHAVAVVKAGVFVMLKVSIYIFGPDLMQALPAAKGLAAIAGATIVIASLIAMTKDNLKARLAYSTISQLAYVTLGAMLATPAALLGAALQILMHAFGKITLFMAAGAIYTGSKQTEISAMRGLGRAMPWTFGAFLVGALSIIGLPPLGGAWAKLQLAIGAAEADRPWLIAVLAVSSVLNVAYLLPIAVRGFFQAADDSRPKPKGAPLLAVLAPCVTALGCFLLFFAVDGVAQFLAPIFEPGGRR